MLQSSLPPKEERNEHSRAAEVDGSVGVSIHRPQVDPLSRRQAGSEDIRSSSRTEIVGYEQNREAFYSDQRPMRQNNRPVRDRQARPLLEMSPFLRLIALR